MVIYDMNFSEYILMALASLKANKMRAFLTMLGIIIGISAVITITTMGNIMRKTEKMLIQVLVQMQ